MLTDGWPAGMLCSFPSLPLPSRPLTRLPAHVVAHVPICLPSHPSPSTRHLPYQDPPSLPGLTQLDRVIEFRVSSYVEPHGVLHDAASRVLVQMWSAPFVRFQ